MNLLLIKKIIIIVRYFIWNRRRNDFNKFASIITKNDRRLLILIKIVKSDFFLSLCNHAISVLKRNVINY